MDTSEFCHEYNWAIYKSRGSTYAVTVLIAILNIIIRFMNMTLIKGIGYNYETQQARMIMFSIFYT